VNIQFLVKNCGTLVAEHCLRWRKCRKQSKKVWIFSILGNNFNVEKCTIYTCSYLWFVAIPPFSLGVDVTRQVLLSCVFDWGVPLTPSTVSISTTQPQILRNSKYIMHNHYFLLPNLLSNFLNDNFVRKLSWMTASKEPHLAKS
jgi:hypothetical protein